MNLTEVSILDKISGWSYFTTSLFGESYYVARCDKYDEFNDKIQIELTDALLSIGSSSMILTDIDKGISGSIQRKPCIIKKLSNKVESEWENDMYYYRNDDESTVSVKREFSNVAGAWCINVSVTLKGENYHIIAYSRKVQL